MGEQLALDFSVPAGPRLLTARELVDGLRVQSVGHGYEGGGGPTAYVTRVLTVAVAAGSFATPRAKLVVRMCRGHETFASPEHWVTFPRDAACPCVACNQTESEEAA